MPRYIDLDKAIQDVESVGAYYSEEETVKELCLFELKEQPIADVVPRSEVEKAKQEVAREIFEEIEKHLPYLAQQGWVENLKSTLAELKKKYIGG